MRGDRSCRVDARYRPRGACVGGRGKLGDYSGCPATGQYQNQTGGDVSEKLKTGQGSAGGLITTGRKIALSKAKKAALVDCLFS